MFDKLFRRASEGFLARSVLDLVLEQSKSLKRRASAADSRKIDEYLEAVRAVEKRLDFAEEQTQLHLALLQRIGVPVQEFGETRTPLYGLSP